MRLLPNGQFVDPAVIAASGQTFRMEGRDGAWFLVQGESVVRLKKQHGEVRYEVWGDLDVEQVFRCDVDPAELQRELQVDDYVAAAAQRWKGLWLLRQDPWETTVSFIISANKHFRHIQQCCRMLAERYGKQLETPWGRFYAFPRPEVLAAVSEDALRECKVGYRSSFIADAARRLMQEPEFLNLEGLSTVEAVDRLTQIHGIGDKIADCILLFAYGRDEIVPYDVWLRRICVDVYGLPEKATYAQLREWHRGYFGPLAGWAQQWLFCHARDVYQRGQILRDVWYR